MRRLVARSSVESNATGKEISTRGFRVRWWWVCVLIGWLMSGTVGYAQEATPPSAATAAATPDPTAGDIAPVRGGEAFRLAFLNPYPDNDIWQGVQAAIEERADADAVAVDIFALDAPSAPMQIAQIEEAIDQEFDGIILGAVDAVGIVPGIVAANEAGVPVLAIDTAPANGQIVSLVRIGNVAAAQAAGEFIASAIDGAGIVLNLQGDMTTDIAQDRDKGVRGAWQRYSDIDVVSEGADWNRAAAAGITSGFLLPAEGGTPIPSDPQLRAIFAANDTMALGAVDAVRAAGRDNILIVGFGGTADALAAIEAGDLTATIAQLPNRIGGLSVDALVRHLNGDPVPPRIDPGYVLVTADNISQFIERRSA